MDARERKKAVRGIKKSKDDPAQAQALMQRILDGPGMAYAEKKMREHRDRAVAMLDSLPGGEARSALADLVDFTISRKK